MFSRKEQDLRAYSSDMARSSGNALHPSICIRVGAFRAQGCPRAGVIDDLEHARVGINSSLFALRAKSQN